MKLIFAQGNIGAEYVGTRHNIGFMVIDNLRARIDAPDFQEKRKFQAYMSETTYGGEKILLAKPTTFYNLTGQSARKITDFYHIPLEDVLVIHDDLALKFGTIRVRLGGSDAGNNGIKSLNAHVGKDYWRLRVGIGAAERDIMADADFVLGRFSAAEKEVINNYLLHDSIPLIEQFITNQISPTSLSIQK
ncbi:aminoacyl-tRNA hydrolase [Candidatus Saccharibacteria bacterium]|nr:aminoacyl-tRNA hydrolase [Candidatus Saccharibacteria bacterium]